MNSNKNILTAGALIAILIGVFAATMYFTNDNNDNEEPEIQEEDNRIPDGPLVEEEGKEGTIRMKYIYEQKATLSDVSGGNATGKAYAGLNDQELFQLYVEFQNLPTLSEGQFYEGWLLRSDPFDSFSTGPLMTVDSNHVNNFQAVTNYLDYDTYVLTIEENDGNPEAGDHILEGEFVSADEENTTTPEAVESPTSESGDYVDYSDSVLANADAKVDYDTSTELKEKYNVRTQHTFAQVDSEGNELNTWIGSFTLEDFLNNVF